MHIFYLDLVWPHMLKSFVFLIGLTCNKVLSFAKSEETINYQNNTFPPCVFSREARYGAYLPSVMNQSQGMIFY